MIGCPPNRLLFDDLSVGVMMTAEGEYRVVEETSVLCERYNTDLATVMATAPPVEGLREYRQLVEAVAPEPSGAAIEFS